MIRHLEINQHHFSRAMTDARKGDLSKFVRLVTFLYAREVPIPAIAEMFLAAGCSRTELLKMLDAKIALNKPSNPYVQ